MQESYRVVVPDRYLRTRFVDDIVVVQKNDVTLVSTDLALQLIEGVHPAVTYVPIDELGGANLRHSTTQFHCRWKGDACYYHVHLDSGEVVVDGAWSYPSAPEELALLRKQVAFDVSKFSLQFIAKQGSSWGS